MADKATIAKSLADGVVVHLHENNYDSATTNISVFIQQQRNISFQNDVS